LGIWSEQLPSAVIKGETMKTSHHRHRLFRSYTAAGKEGAVLSLWVID
jgi:hypothetical protein